jgi:dTDP-4-amino-4,6-dideoxygalactose transaminase
VSDPVARFEQAFADFFTTGQATAFWKGRVALYAILDALDVGQGDEVIVPGYTCVMNVNPILYRGAKPVYADIDPQTYNMDPRKVQQCVTDRTRVIIAQHTYGIPADVQALAQIAGQHGIALIEDCCLALGSTRDAKLCGTFGRAAYFSFQWNKPFTTGVGGMTWTADETLARGIREFKNQQIHKPPAKAALLLGAQRTFHRALVYPKTTAFLTKTFRWLTRKGLVVGSSSNAEFQPVMPEGFLQDMGRGQGRAGLRRIRNAQKNIRHRRHMSRLYDQLLAEAGFPTAPRPENTDPVLVRYPVGVADKDRAVAMAPGAKVELGTWFECPLHPEETPMELYGYTQGLCPVAEEACRHVVNLPTHPRADEKTARRSVAFLKSLRDRRPENQP